MRLRAVEEAAIKELHRERLARQEQRMKLVCSLVVIAAAPLTSPAAASPAENKVGKRERLRLHLLSPQTAAAFP